MRRHGGKAEVIVEEHGPVVCLEFTCGVVYSLEKRGLRA